MESHKEQSGNQIATQYSAAKDVHDIVIDEDWKPKLEQTHVLCTTAPNLYKTVTEPNLHKPWTVSARVDSTSPTFSNTLLLLLADLPGVLKDKFKDLAPSTCLNRPGFYNDDRIFK